MASAMIIPCPHCHTLNRVPAERHAQSGKCGHCGKPLFTGHSISLDAAHFSRHADATDLPLLVDFWASWCAPCRAMAPAFEGAARQFEPELRFAKVDTDAEQELAARYNIQAIPTMILFRGGHEFARQSGAMPAGLLNAWIEQQLSKLRSAPQ